MNNQPQHVVTATKTLATGFAGGDDLDAEPNPFDRPEDVREAMLAISSIGAMRNIGINEHFADLFARTVKNLGKVPPSTREKIKSQFAIFAFDLSYSDSVGRYYSEEKQRALAQWLQGVCLLLATAGTWPEREG
jgi:hypothetical protein